MNKKTDDSILVVKRALTVFEELLKSSSAMGVNEIAKKLEYQPSTTHRVLKTLESEKWLYQDSEQKYHIGSKFSYYAQDNINTILKDVAYYVMQKMSKQETQAMNLSIRRYDKIMIIQQTRTDRMIDLVPPLGSNVPVHASAGGKILLANAPKDELKEIINLINFDIFTPHTITNKKDLLLELEVVKRQDFAYDYRESIENGCCIGVPVRAHNGTVVAALSFSGILGNQTKEDLMYYVPYLKGAAKEISDKITF